MSHRPMGAHSDAKRANAVMCPLRFGEPCTLCMPYVNGPEDCQSVALVMSDPELKAKWAKGFSAWRRQQREAKKAAQERSTAAASPGASRNANDARVSALNTGSPVYW